MCYTFNKTYYFCVIYGSLKSCNFHLWQISLTKLSLLALMTFLRHRRQQISLTARYSLDIHPTPAPPFLNIMPAVASCVGTAVSTKSLSVYKTIKTKNTFYQLVLPLNYFNSTWAWRLYGCELFGLAKAEFRFKLNNFTKIKREKNRDFVFFSVHPFFRFIRFRFKRVILYMEMYKILKLTDLIIQLELVKTNCFGSGLILTVSSYNRKPSKVPHCYFILLLLTNFPIYI